MSTSSFAQTMPPNAADLKTAYCLPLKQRNLAMVNEVIPMLRAETAPAARELLEDEIKRKSRLEDEVRRMRAYLSPRVPYLVPSALISASQRFAEDEKNVDSCGCTRGIQSRSFDFGSVEICMKQCDASTGGAIERIRSCENVNWLPF